MGSTCLYIVATGQSEGSLYRCRRLARLDGGHCTEVKMAAGIPPP
jgi:hypothetical protein